MSKSQVLTNEEIELIAFAVDQYHQNVITAAHNKVINGATYHRLVERIESIAEKLKPDILVSEEPPSPLTNYDVAALVESDSRDLERDLISVFPFVLCSEGKSAWDRAFTGFRHAINTRIKFTRVRQIVRPEDCGL